MATVYLITHPEVVVDPQVPVPDWGLSAIGWARIEAFCQRPELAGVTDVFTSDERKAMDCAEALQRARGLPFTAREDLREIVNIQISRLARRLEGQSLTIEVSDGAKERLAQEGYEPEFGARPLRRAIMNLIEDPLSEKLLSGDVQVGDKVAIEVENDEVVIRPLGTRPTEEPAEAAPTPA